MLQLADVGKEMAILILLASRKNELYFYFMFLLSTWEESVIWELLRIILVFWSWIYLCKDVSGRALAKFELHLLAVEGDEDGKDADKWTLVDFAEAVFYHSTNANCQSCSSSAGNLPHCVHGSTHYLSWNGLWSWLWDYVQVSCLSAGWGGNLFVSEL